MSAYSKKLVDIQFQKIGHVAEGQDGAICNGYLFRLNTKGICTVTALANLTKVAEFALDGLDAIVPHSNSVCFGNTYFYKGDEFPLLYTNVYNNYQNHEDRKEGVCCVYRIIREGDVFSSQLVEIIKINFTKDILWRSENIADARPYGNFVLDTENGFLYAFVMRDEEHKTRVFRFNIPEISPKATNEIRVIALNKNDIIDMFDCAYLEYMQGAAFENGYIYSVNGFGKQSRYKPSLSIIDAKNKETCLSVCLVDYGLEHEPEFIDVYEGQVFYSDSIGDLYKIHFHE